MRDLLRRQWHEFWLNLRPRELAYWLALNLLRLIYKIALRVQLYGAEDYAPPAPATLLLSGHKRDWDPPLFAATLYYLRGWWRPDGRRMAFAGREDMFTPGFLVEIVGNAEWPRWAQRLLERTALKPIIGPLRAYPIARYPEFGIRHYLFEVQREQGDLPLAAIFSDEFLQRLDRRTETLASRQQRRFQARPGYELRISDVLNWNYRDLLQQRLNPRLLLPEQWQRFKTLQRDKVQQQLGVLLGAVARGDTLWLAPEGHISVDGRLHRVRKGLAALLPLAPPGTRVLASNVTYDFMTTGRPRACIAVGPASGLAVETAPKGVPLPNPPARVPPAPSSRAIAPTYVAGGKPAPKGVGRVPEEGSGDGTPEGATSVASDFSQQVIAAVNRQTVVTMSQLGSRFFWNRLQAGQPVFETKEALFAVAQDVQSLARQAAHIERGLLDERHLRRRLRAFLAYGVRHGLLSRASRSTYQINPAPFQEWPQNFVWLNPRYCVNELESLEAALAARERSEVADQHG